MIIEEYVNQYPDTPTHIILGRGASRGETIEIGSSRWDEVKVAELDNVKEITVITKRVS